MLKPVSEMKVATIVGARPQFIKAAVVSRAFRAKSDEISEVLIHTGQHYDDNMSQIFFDELDIPRPDYNLGIGGGSHGQNTGRMLEEIEGILTELRPDWLLVYGDTDSTLAGALAAVKLHIRVAHVEAGLRSFNRCMPEEINRVLTDHAAELLFTPTNQATSNLAKEGIGEGCIRQVGDVMYDAALFYKDLASRNSDILERLKMDERAYVLATVHREENTDNRDRLHCILKGFEDSGANVVWPMHPRTKKQLSSFGIPIPGNVMSIDPVGYLDMIQLESHAAVIATDSGGVQKEAFFQKVPCVTLREETEWVELVDLGYNQLVGADSRAISVCLQGVAGTSFGPENIYGNGDAGTKIVTEILR